MTHTKGPWSYHTYLASGPNFGIETADHRHGIAAIRPNDTASTMLTMEEHEANARLIAAAPELLEIVSALHEWFEENGYNGNGPSGCSLICSDDSTLGEHIRIAMAKVTGPAK